MSLPETVDYPFNDVPLSGEARQVAEDVYWVRMPMPGKLDHINVWLLRDVDSWVVVDTGLATDETVDLWWQIWHRDTEKLPVGKVIGTHMHPDHIGLAGWICQKSGAALYMSRAEYLSCQHLLTYTHREAPEDAVNFYRQAGYSADDLDYYRSRFGSFGQLVRSLPESYRRLKEDDQLQINGRTWQVVVGEGHSPEHVCLYCAELNLFIGGDQLLPKISSLVSVYPTEPTANPLQQWLDSCRRLGEFLPGDVLVLPSHGLPFIGAGVRLAQLVKEHEEALKQLLSACAKPMRVRDAFPILFRSEINKHNLSMATGESLAHFHCLQAEGRVRSWLDESGVRWFQSDTQQ